MNDKATTVWVVIPTWNRLDDLTACLDSLGHITSPNIEIVVVDNGSTDDTSAVMEQRYSEVHLIRLEKNMGAPFASNAGFDFALAHQAEAVLRLDSDTVVAPDFLEILLKTAQVHPQVGVLSPKIYYFDPPNRIWYAGADAHPWHYGAIHENKDVEDAPVHDRARLVDYVWGACMLIKAEVLRKTGGFDPDFFIYHEEVDFCRRVQNLGYQLFYVPESKVWHKIGTLTPSAWKAYEWNRSKVLLYKKHARNALHFGSLILYTVLYALLSPILKGVMAGNRGPLGSAIQGIMDGLRNKHRRDA